MDRLQSMEVFVRVAERGGFSAVAKEIGISPTMVGKHIRALEERLGARLLNRTTRRQGLTEAGAAYLERCSRVLAELEGAEASVADLRRTPRGVLRIGSPVTFGTQCLAPVLARYLADNREVSVELVLNDRPMDLLEEGLETAIRIGRLEDSSLVARRLLPYRSTICASPDYLAREGRPRTPADLARHNCLGFLYWDRRKRWRLLSASGETRVKAQGNFTANQGQALRMAALAGIGIIMQPEILVADDLAAGRLVRVLPRHAPPERPMHLVWLPERRPSPRLRSFIDLIAERFGDQRAAQPPVRRGTARASRNSSR